MKKIMYLFLAGIMSTAMFSCDNNGNDDGGDVEKDVPFVGTQPLSIEITTPNSDFPDGVSTETIAYTLNADKKITNVKYTSYALMSETETQKIDVDYPVTQDAKTITVDCGDDLLIVFNINDKGFPATAEAKYASDGVIAAKYTFNYDNKGMLTTIVDGDKIAVFSATYDVKRNMITFGGGDEEFTYGKIENHSVITPALFMLYGGASNRLEGVATFATVLGLVPQSLLLPKSISDMLITTKVSTTGLLTNYSIGEGESEMMNFVLKY